MYASPGRPSYDCKRGARTSCHPPQTEEKYAQPVPGAERSGRDSPYYVVVQPDLVKWDKLPGVADSGAEEQVFVVDEGCVNGVALLVSGPIRSAWTTLLPGSSPDR